MAVQASSYGEEDIDPEGSDAIMSDKATYTFEELVDQVQVSSLCSACLRVCRCMVKPVYLIKHATAADCHLSCHCVISL